MSQLNYDKILDYLAPNCLGAVKTLKENSIKIDDNKIQKDKETYINGTNIDLDSLSSINVDLLALKYTQGLQILESKNLTNISKLGYWKPSSTKIGNPISNVLDESFDTFWQSDGLQPHVLEITFNKIMNISMIAIFVSLIADESYTPNTINVFAGTSSSDSVFYKKIEVVNMNGWFVLTFEDNRDDHLLKCGYLKFSFPINHENGKDTHLRGMRIYAPSETQSKKTTDLRLILDGDKNLFTEFSLR